MNGGLEAQIPGRVFLVGCPRSGTTLLQALLSAHSRIHSLPETHFFQQLLRTGEGRRLADPTATRRKRIARRLQNWSRHATASLGWVSGPRGRKAWQALPELDADASSDLRGLAAYRLQQHIHRFGTLLDRQCLRARKRLWLEKTPDHLFYIAHIQRHFPTARFIHILRDGEEVVASLYHAAQRYEPWRPYLQIERGIDRWNRALAESLSWRRHPSHLLVRYEALMADPQRTLARILHFLDCPDEPGICAAHAQAVSRLVRPDEPWKRGNFDALGNRRKFHKLFDSDQQHRIVAGLDKPDWSALARLPRVLA
ncbi:MAG: sulfotransferase family protein [Pseudoxanthomonas sp.]